MNRLVLPLLLALLVSACGGTRAPFEATAGARPAVPTAEDYRTELLLRRTPHPPRDLYELYPRLRGLEPASIERAAGSTVGWRLGHTRQFYVGNLDKKVYTARAATLRHISPSAYFWVESGRTVDQAALEAAAERFDGVVARNRATFGSEWRPGVDGDPRLVVLIADTPGAGGYYSSADEYPRSINPYSNEHEMIYVNVESPPGTPFFDSVLAHEFQHMIHWNQHANQDVWLNEGMSEYAVELNEFAEGLPEQAYASQPDTQLNTWTDNPNSAGAHYGQSYRFMSYLAGRYEPAFMSAIIRAPGWGLNAVDRAVRRREPNGSIASVYGDWLAANALGTRGEGRLRLRPGVTPVVTETLAPGAPRETTVRQWGADYYKLDGNGPIALELRAAPRVRLVPNEPKSGAYQWYSNRGDLLDSRLTREVDLRGVQGATLEMDLWYDIERDYDYAYVSVSTDGGKRWRTMEGRNTTNENPNGNNLGNGLTGESGGWIMERFDLSPYAGGRVQLRVEYVTDDGYNAQGIVVDGVRIPEIGLEDDSETEHGWRSEGWIRGNNTVPGRYRLLVVDPERGESYLDVPVGADGRAIASLPADAGEPRTVIVSGAAETTTQESAYTLVARAAEAGVNAAIGGRVGSAE